MNILNMILEALNEFFTANIGMVSAGIIFAVIGLTALAVLIILTKVKKFKYIKSFGIFAGVIVWAHYFSTEYFPIFLSKSNVELDGFWGLKQSILPVTKFVPFVNFSLIAAIYFIDFFEFLLAGFLLVMSVKTLSKAVPFLIFSVGINVLEILFVLINNQLHSGVSTVYDLSNLFVSLLALWSGFGLAKLLIKKKPAFYEKIQSSSV